jgi:hypothetical protein
VAALTKVDLLRRRLSMANLKQLLNRFRGKGAPISGHSQAMAVNPKEDIPVLRRQLSEQEMSWVHEITAANPEWSGIDIGELYAIAKCPCGECKSVKLERPSTPQNPRWTNRAHGETSFLRFGFPVGSAYIKAKNHGLVQVMLFTDEGFLDWLDVVSLEFKPLPDTIEELSRDVSTDRS